MIGAHNNAMARSAQAGMGAMGNNRLLQALLGAGGMEWGQDGDVEFDSVAMMPVESPIDWSNVPAGAEPPGARAVKFGPMPPAPGGGMAGPMNFQGQPVSQAEWDAGKVADANAWARLPPVREKGPGLRQMGAAPNQMFDATQQKLADALANINQDQQDGLIPPHEAIQQQARLQGSNFSSDRFLPEDVSKVPSLTVKTASGWQQDMSPPPEPVHLNQFGQRMAAPSTERELAQGAADARAGHLARGGSVDPETGALRGKYYTQSPSDGMQVGNQDGGVPFGSTGGAPRPAAGNPSISMLRAMAKANMRGGLPGQQAWGAALGMAQSQGQNFGNNDALVSALVNPDLPIADRQAKAAEAQANSPLTLALIEALTKAGIAQAGIGLQQEIFDRGKPENVAKGDQIAAESGIAVDKIKKDARNKEIVASGFYNPNDQENKNAHREEWSKSGFTVETIPPGLEEYLVRAWESGEHDDELGSGSWLSYDSKNFSSGMSAKTGVPRDALENFYKAKLDKNSWSLWSSP